MYQVNFSTKNAPVFAKAGQKGNKVIDLNFAESIESCSKINFVGQKDTSHNICDSENLNALGKNNYSSPSAVDSSCKSGSSQRIRISKMQENEAAKYYEERMKALYKDLNEIHKNKGSESQHHSKQESLTHLNMQGKNQSNNNDFVVFKSPEKIHESLNQSNSIFSRKSERLDKSVDSKKRVTKSLSKEKKQVETPSTRLNKKIVSPKRNINCEKATIKNEIQKLQTTNIPTAKQLEFVASELNQRKQINYKGNAGFVDLSKQNVNAENVPTICVNFLSGGTSLSMKTDENSQKVKTTRTNNATNEIEENGDSHFGFVFNKKKSNHAVLRQQQSNIGINLYEKGRILQNSKIIIQQKTKEAENQKELSECSFSPKINLKSSLIAEKNKPTLAIQDRTKALLEAKYQRISKFQKENIKRELQECTFNPDVLKPSIKKIDASSICNVYNRNLEWLRKKEQDNVKKIEKKENDFINSRQLFKQPSQYRETQSRLFDTRSTKTNSINTFKNNINLHDSFNKSNSTILNKSIRSAQSNPRPMKNANDNEDMKEAFNIFNDLSDFISSGGAPALVNKKNKHSNEISKHSLKQCEVIIEKRRVTDEKELKTLNLDSHANLVRPSQPSKSNGFNIEKKKF